MKNATSLFIIVSPETQAISFPTIRRTARRMAAVLSLLLLALLPVTAQQAGNCLSFNGSNSGVSFSNNDLGLGGSNAMTITTWVKWTNHSSADNGAVLATISNGNLGQFWLQHDSTNQHFQFAVENSAGLRMMVTSQSTPVDNKWYHVAGVFDGSTLYLYVNGIQEGTNELAGPIHPWMLGYDFALGHDATGSAGHFNGLLDETSIWDRALTETEIRERMCSKLNLGETGLVAYWMMNQGSGNLIDNTANSHNGSLSNCTYVTSGAPVGDASVYTYGGSSLAISHPVNNDTMRIDSFQRSTPVGIHLYRVDGAANVTIAPPGFQNLINDYYFGVFIVNADGEVYKAIWKYAGHPGTQYMSMIGAGQRSANDGAIWNGTAAANDTIAGTLEIPGQTDQNEYVLATMEGFPTVHNGSTRGPAVLLNRDSVSLNDSINTVPVSGDTTSHSGGTLTGNGGFGSRDTSSHVRMMNNGLHTMNMEAELNNNNAQDWNTDARVASAEGTVKEGFKVGEPFPNPFDANFSLRITTENESPVLVTVQSLDGRVIAQEQINGNGGEQTYTFTAASELPAGLYLVTLTSNGQSLTKKMTCRH